MMNKDVKKGLKIAVALTLLAALFLFFVIFLQGCAAPQSFEKVVQIKAELHICSDRSYFPLGHEKADGVATQDKTGKCKIYVTGYLEKGKYYIDNLITLGHELAHIAEYSDREIADPDKY